MLDASCCTFWARDSSCTYPAPLLALPFGFCVRFWLYTCSPIFVLYLVLAYVLGTCFGALFFVRPEALAFLQKQATCLPKVGLCSFDLTTRTINQIYIAFFRIARLRCVLPFLPHSSSQIQHLFGLSRQKNSRRALPDCPQSTNDKKY